MASRIVTKFIIILLLINFLLANKNMTELFKEFKLRYHKFYFGPKHEEKAFNNFANNIMKVHELNLKRGVKPVAYVLNKYADLDPEEINETYGITIVPYTESNLTIRTQNDKLPSLEEMNLYNLNQVKNLYQDWLQKNGKKNYTKKYDRKVHYYRFVKTVVELNRMKAEGKDVELDANADTVQHPDDYFYG